VNVLLTKNFFDSDLEFIKERVSPNINFITPKSFDDKGLLPHIENTDVLLGGYFSDVLLGNAKQLKFIQIPWNGVDNLCFELLRKHNSTVCNSHSNAGAVAEHAVALMLDAAKKIAFHDREMRTGNWNRLFPSIKNKISPFSRQITNSKVGFIGFGAISQHIHKLLSGFSCKHAIFTRTGTTPLELSDNESFYQINDFVNNAKELDFLFVCIPLTSQTKGLIDDSFFSAMNDKTIIINISRGSVMNEKQLFDALNQKKIGGAAIDTWYNYPNPENPIAYPSKEFKFHKLDNLVMSPHRAGYIDSGFPHLYDVIENLNRSIKDEPLKNIISLKDSY
jgi:phosphoglycerate dehydrogenase-like enzyme